MSCPSKRISPRSEGKLPEIWLMSVVLPAPLGPISAWTSPLLTSSDTSSVATTPTKRFDTRLSSSTAPPRQQPGDAVRREQHDRQHHQAAAQVGVLRVVGRNGGEPGERVVGDHMLEAEEHERPDGPAPELADAAQDHHDHQRAGLHPVQHVRVDVLAVAREERPGEPGDRAGDDEAGELVAVYRQADCLGPRLVFADRDHYPAEARLHEPVEPVKRKGEKEKHHVVKHHLVAEIEAQAQLGALRQGQAFVAAVRLHRIDEVERHLREGERDHDEVNPARAQRHRADQPRRERRGGDRRRPAEPDARHALGDADARGVGAGAYAASICIAEGVASAWLGWPAAIAASALAAWLIGAVSLRTRGVYFIMITLAFAQMAFYLVNSMKAYGGDEGLPLPQRAELGLGLDLGNEVVFYYVVLFFLALSLYGLHRLMQSRFGRVVIAIRENEARAEAIGLPVYRYQLACFVIAGAVAGLAGALLASHGKYVNPNVLHWVQSGTLMIMVILGGVGQLWGGAIGAFVLLGLEHVISDYPLPWLAAVAPNYPQHANLGVGLVMLAVVLFAPHGIAGLLSRRRGA